PALYRRVDDVPYGHRDRGQDGAPRREHRRGAAAWVKGRTADAPGQHADGAHAGARWERVVQPWREDRHLHGFGDWAGAADGPGGGGVGGELTGSPADRREPAGPGGIEHRRPHEAPDGPRGGDGPGVQREPAAETLAVAPAGGAWGGDAGVVC